MNIGKGMIAGCVIFGLVVSVPCGGAADVGEAEVNAAQWNEGLLFANEGKPKRIAAIESYGGTISEESAKRLVRETLRDPETAVAAAGLLVRQRRERYAAPLLIAVVARADSPPDSVVRACHILRLRGSAREGTEDEYFRHRAQWEEHYAAAVLFGILNSRDESRTRYLVRDYPTLECDWNAPNLIGLALLNNESVGLRRSGLELLSAHKAAARIDKAGLEMIIFSRVWEAPETAQLAHNLLGALVHDAQQGPAAQGREKYWQDWWWQKEEAFSVLSPAIEYLKGLTELPSARRLDDPPAALPEQEAFTAQGRRSSFPKLGFGNWEIGEVALASEQIRVRLPTLTEEEQTSIYGRLVPLAQDHAVPHVRITAICLLGYDAPFASFHDETQSLLMGTLSSGRTVRERINAALVLSSRSWCLKAPVIDLLRKTFWDPKELASVRACCGLGLVRVEPRPKLAAAALAILEAELSKAEDMRDKDAIGWSVWLLGCTTGKSAGTDVAAWKKIVEQSPADEPQK